MGSKNALATKIVELLPRATHLYDLFCGGGAVTHAAMLSCKWQVFHNNDLNSGMVKLFSDAVAGKYHNEQRWIDRETFFANCAQSAYIGSVWSFGNKGDAYLYAKEITPWKHAYWAAVVWHDLSEFHEMGIFPPSTNRAEVRTYIRTHHEDCKRLYIAWWLKQQNYSQLELNELIARCKRDITVQSENLRQYLLRGLESSGLSQSEVNARLGTQMCGHYFGKSQWAFPTEEYYNKMREFMPALDKDYNEVVGLTQLWQSLERLQRLESLQSLERLQSLQSLESLQRLQRLERLERLETGNLHSTSMNYYDVPIAPDSVIYCDPPYRGTAEYTCGGFDHERFYEWCEVQTVPLFISEYSMPEDRFVCVAEFKHCSRLNQRGATPNIERIFMPRRQYYAKPRQLTLCDFGL